MKLPNFFILGAAKSGTSSLYRYLGQHPDVFVSPVKEPGFFIWMGREYNVKGAGIDNVRKPITDFEAYQKLFEPVTTEKAIGEASTGYLHTPEVPARLRAYLSSAKLIAILRNPIDRAYSAFLHARRQGLEPDPDFESALRAEPGRVREGWIGLTHYVGVGTYGEQLERYKKEFPSKQIRVYFFDDLSQDPLRLIRDAFGFLKVDAFFEPNTREKYNVGVAGGSPRLYALLKSERVKRAARRLIPSTARRRLTDTIRRMNQAEDSLRPDLSQQLADTFEPDILKLSKMLQRDLSPWLGGESLPLPNEDEEPGRHPN